MELEVDVEVVHRQEEALSVDRLAFLRAVFAKWGRSALLDVWLNRKGRPKKMARRVDSLFISLQMPPPLVSTYDRWLMNVDDHFDNSIPFTELDKWLKGMGFTGRVDPSTYFYIEDEQTINHNPPATGVGRKCGTKPKSKNKNSKSMWALNFRK